MLDRTRSVAPEGAAFERGDSLSSADYLRLAAFRHALRSFLNFSEVAAAGIGLTGAQYQALLVVRARPPLMEMTVSELAGLKGA